MADLLISARNLLVDVNRLASKQAASTIAPSEDPPPGVPENAKMTGSQPAQLSTLGGFKNALAEFRNAAATLTALAKVLALKPLFTASLPEAANPGATAAQTVDAASLFAATSKPAPGSGQNPVTRPALLLNDSSLLDADLPQARPQAGSSTAVMAGSLATSSKSTTALVQAIQTFVTAHNRLVTILTHLADSGAAPTLELPTAGGDPSGPKLTVAQSSGNDELPGNVAPADLGKQARRLLDTLTVVTARLPGLPAVGLTSGQDGELRLDAGRLQAAMVVQPRTIARLFSAIDLNPDEMQPSPPSLSPRSSGAVTTTSPLATLNAALTDFQEKTRIVTGLARLLANPAPVAERSPGQAVLATNIRPPFVKGDGGDLTRATQLPISPDPAAAAPLLKPATGEVAPSMPRTATPVSMAGLALVKPEGSAPAIETLYLNQEETLLSTALLRPGYRLAPLTLQFQAGRFDAVTQRFLAEPQQSPVNVALSDGNDTLPGLRDAIQASNPELGTAVVKDNAGYRLAMRLPGETMAHSIAVSISKAANPPAADGEGQPLGFTVQRDADAVRNAVQSLVGAYNRLNSAAGSLSGDLQVQALAGPLRQSLAGALANPDRGRALARVGVMVQRDGSLLIEPVRLSAAATTHPKQVLDLFADHEGGEDGESGSVAGLTDSFTDWLAEIRDSKEPWDSQLDDQSPEAALNPDGGQRSDGGRNAAEVRYRTRLETVNRLTQRLFSTELWLRQELERLSGGSDSTGVIGITAHPMR
jgi:flagellar capping protein FliD